MYDTDQPLKNTKEDALGRKAFALKLAESIMDYRIKDNLVIGLMGEWGSGKSTILNFTVELLNKNKSENKPLIIHFNPWYFTEQTRLIEQFFNNLIRELEQHKKGKKDVIKDTLDETGKALEKYCKMLSPLFLLAGIGPIAEIMKHMGQSLQQATDRGNKGIEEIKNDINQGLSSVKTKIIIIIDDIDRMNDQEIRQIFMLVKQLADFDNIIYLLAFDKNIVSRALDNIQKDTGDKYIEKIVQVPIAIPEYNNTDLIELITQRMFRTKIQQHTLWDNHRWENLFLGYICRFPNNIRNAIRFINNLKFKWANTIDEVNPIDLLIICWMQTYYPEIYDFIKLNKKLLTSPPPESAYEELIQDLTSENGELTSGAETIIEDIIKRNVFEDQKQELMYGLLERLFPRIKKHSVSEEEDFLLNRQLRVAGHTYFDRYFTLRLDKSEISIPYIKTILDSIANKQSRNHLIELFSERGQCESCIEYLENNIELLPMNTIKEIIPLLFDYSDVILKNYINYSLISPDRRIDLLVSQCLIKLAKSSSRDLNILETIYEEISKSIFFPIVFLERCERLSAQIHNNEAVDADKRYDLLLSMDLIISLKTKALKNLEDEWIKKNRLSDAYDSAYLLRFYEKENSPAATHFIRDKKKSLDGFIELLSYFLMKSEKQSAHDYAVTYEYGFEVSLYRKFIPLGEAQNRCREIKESEFYEHLENPMKIAIDQLLSLSE